MRLINWCATRWESVQHAHYSTLGTFNVQLCSIRFDPERGLHPGTWIGDTRIWKDPNYRKATGLGKAPTARCKRCVAIVRVLVANGAKEAA